MSMRRPRNILHLVLEPSHSKKGRHSFVFWARSTWLTFCSCFHFVTCGSLWATKLPAITAFPRGLPEDLEAIAILPAVSDGSVDSDNSGRLNTPSFDHPHYSIDFHEVKYLPVVADVNSSNACGVTSSFDHDG